MLLEVSPEGVQFIDKKLDVLVSACGIRDNVTEKVGGFPLRLIANHEGALLDHQLLHFGLNWTELLVELWGLWLFSVALRDVIEAGVDTFRLFHD